MYPYLKPLDEVKLIFISQDEVRIGDVIAYFDSASKVMTVHRVVGKNKRQLSVKGDNNWKKDDTRICADDVLIVDKIYRDKNNIDAMHPFYRSVVNLIFVFLSVTRVNFLLFGRKIQYNKKIGGRTVTDKVYRKFERYIDINKNQNSLDKK
jgi:hypothetical protein